MINDRLKNSIKRMGQLYQAANNEEDLRTRKKNEAEFRDSIKMLSITMEKINFAKQNLNFQISDETRDSLLRLIDQLSEASQTDIIDYSELYDSRTTFRKVTSKLKQDWSICYRAKIKKSSGTLEIIRGLIDKPEIIDRIQNDLEQAVEWEKLTEQSNGKSKLESFQNSLAEIEEMMQSLQLSEEVRAFLDLVSREKADVSDLNDEVLKWISEKNFQNTFTIRFANK